MLKLSPSAVGSALECPRCLWLAVNQDIKTPSGIFPSLPSGMDGVFKVYFDSYRTKGLLPPEIAGKINGKLFGDLEKLKIWRNNRQGLKFEFPAYDIVLKGAIDELLVDPEGKFIVMDFKTRGYPLKEDTHEHYQAQLDLYGLLFAMNGYPVADCGYLLFFYPKSYNRGSATFNAELVKMVVSPRRGLGLLKKVHEIVSGRKPKVNPECEWCAYRKNEV